MLNVFNANGNNTKITPHIVVLFRRNILARSYAETCLSNLEMKQTGKKPKSKMYLLFLHLSVKAYNGYIYLIFKDKTGNDSKKQTKIYISAWSIMKQEFYA